MVLKFFKYNIPFNEPFRTASEVFEYRTGVIIRLKKDGITALAEAAPLPGFSRETLPQVVDKIRSHKNEIRDHFASSFSRQSTAEFSEQFVNVPSLQFSLITVAATYLAQQNESSLQQLLFQTDNTSVPINAVLGAGSGNRMKKVDGFVKSGYKTIKLKVDPSFSTFLDLVENIRSKYPALKIRIDANQSWSPDKALTYLAQLESFHIEYCEEPLKKPTVDSIQALKEHCSIPIALDESVFTSFTISQSFELADVIISKPMVCGDQLLSMKVNIATNHDSPKLVFTTSLEGGIGRLMTAALAAGLGESTLAHGLDTGKMLTSDVWDDEQFIEDGCFHLPDANHLKKLMNMDLSDLELQPV